MDPKDQEIAQLKIALSQVTELHDNLVVELRVQYRRARRIGWLPPALLTKLTRTIARTKKDQTVLDGKGVPMKPLDAKQAIQAIESALAKEAKKRDRDADEDADEDDDE